MNRTHTVWSMAALLTTVGASAQELALHGLFGDHMVLPQSTAVPVRGRAPAGVAVEVAAPWLEQPVRAVVGEDGRFCAALPTPVAGGPYRLTIRAGGEERALDDVLVGDVWLCSGQSNMEMPVGPTRWSQGAIDWEQELASAALPQLRMLKLPRRASAEPLSDLDAGVQWEVADPTTVATWSATAFFFGREVQRQRGEPLGLCVSCWGGTVAEAWTRAEGLADFPEFAAGLRAIAVAAAVPAAQRGAAFWAAVERADPRQGPHGAEAPAFDDEAWERSVEPGAWAEGPLRDHDGVVWYRRHIEVPAAWQGRQLLLQLGPIDDLDAVWFEGRRVGACETEGRWLEPRAYLVPGDLVRSGAALVAVRIVDTGGDGGFRGTAEAMRIAPAAGDSGAVALAGSWHRLRGASLDALPSWPRPDGERPNRPALLWNGMIAPLAPFPFRGAIWYQGEANRERADQYARLFPALIEDWRRVFGADLPFLFAQIAPYGYRGDTGELFALRLAQAAALRLPRVGMAATTDIGEPADIHPRQKRSVGERLAWLALRRVHGHADVPAEPVRPRAARRDGTAVWVDFEAGAPDLTTRGDGPRHFELAGEDGVFHPAVAVIEGTAVRVAAVAVQRPTRVRYAHSATAVGDLWDGAGQPAVPFVLTVD